MASTINVLTTGVGGVQTTGDTSGILQMQTNGTATMTIDASGNVGVGTVTPNTIFDVNATTPRVSLSVSGALKAQMNVASSAFNITSNDVTFPITLNAGGAERLRINTSGEIGLSGANYGTSGQYLKSNGPGAAATWGTVAAGGFSNMQVFTSPGTFTTPSTTTQIKVTVVGGGGAGYNRTTTTGQSGGGGGGGGAAIYVGPVTASTPYAVTVGAATGTSSFASLASATGGSNAVANFQAGAGGAGSAGTILFQCSQGATGNQGATAGVLTGGPGGGSLLGAGGGGGNSVTFPAGNGANYGGGGGGQSGPSGAGAGAAGVVIVEY